MARTVVEQLINGGKVRRGQLGVGVQAVTAEIAQSLGLREARGVIVSSVQKGSAADRAGLKQNDVIVAFNGQEVGDPNELRNLVAATQPGTEVTLTLNRDGRQEEVKLSLGELVAAGAGCDREEPGGGEEGEGGGGRLGIAVSPLTPELAARLRLPEGSEGVVVTAVEPDGPAAEARLQQGDLIVQANRQPVRTPDELRAAVRNSGDRPVLLLVTRPGEGTTFVTVRPRK